MGAEICVLLYFWAELLWVIFSVQIDVCYFKSLQGIVKMNQRKKMHFGNRNSLPVRQISSQGMLGCLVKLIVFSQTLGIFVGINIKQGVEGQMTSHYLTHWL